MDYFKVNNTNIIYKYQYQGKEIGKYDPKNHFVRAITLDDWKDMPHLSSIKNYNENLYNDIFKNKSKRYIITREIDTQSGYDYTLISEGLLKPTPDYLIILNRKGSKLINCKFIHNPNITVSKEVVKNTDNGIFNKKIDFSKIKNGDEFRVNKLGLTFYKVTSRNMRADEITMLPKDSNINPREYVVIGEYDDGPDIIIQNKSKGNKIALYHDPNEIVHVRNIFIEEDTIIRKNESYETLFETAINEQIQLQEGFINNKHSLLKKGVRLMNEKQLDRCFLSILRKIEVKSKTEQEKLQAQNLEREYLKKDAESKKEIILKIIDQMNKNNPRSSLKIENNISKQYNENLNEAEKTQDNEKRKKFLVSLAAMVTSILSTIALAFIWPGMLTIGILAVIASILNVGFDIKNLTKKTTNDENNVKVNTANTAKNTIVINVGQFGKYSLDSVNDNITNKWKNIIETNAQYIVNVFLGHVLKTVYMNHDDDYWDKLCIKHDVYNNNKNNLQHIRDEIINGIKKDLPPYLTVGSKNNIQQLFNKYLPNLNYNSFIRSIKIDGISLDDDDGFSIQISDSISSIGEFFCSAYLYFDKTLKAADWHNF